MWIEWNGTIEKQHCISIRPLPVTWLDFLSSSERVAFFFTAWLRVNVCVCEECAALQSTRVCTEKMWTGDEWMASGLGRTSPSLQLVSPHSCSVPHCWATCVLSFSFFQRAFATIVNGDKAFLECHSRTCSCAHWMQLQIRQRAANPARKSDNMLGKRHRRLKCISVSEMLNIHAPAQIPHMCVTLSCF